MRFKLGNYEILNENVADAKKWLETKNIELNNRDFNEIKKMVQKTPNITLLFTKFHFENKISIDELQLLYNQLIDYKNILNKLPKPVVEYESFEELTDNLRDVISNQAFIRFENELPQTLQQALQTIPAEKKDKFKNISKEFFTLDKATRKLFTDKISRYKTTDDLLDAFVRFVSNSKSDFTYQKTLEQISKIKGAEIKFKDDENEIIVIRLFNFSASQALCSLTSWCIKDYESHWTSYVGGEKVYNTQYAIFNFTVPYFDNYSMIGITVKPDGTIYTAHLKNDERIYDDQLFRYIKSLGISKSILSSMGKREILTKDKYFELLNNFKADLNVENGFDNPSYLKKATALVNILLTKPETNLMYNDGIFIYIAIQNDSLDFFKLLVSGGININAEIKLYNFTDRYNKRVYNLSIYDTALLKNAKNILAYLEENNVEKINYDTSYYLNYKLKNSSDEEIKNILSKIDNTKLYELQIFTVDKEPETENNYEKIIYYKETITDFIFDNKSLDIFKFYKNLLPKENKNDVYDEILYDLSIKNINNEKLEYLISNSDSMSKLKENSELSNSNINIINKIFNNIIHNDKINDLKKYNEYLVNYSGNPKSSEILDNALNQEKDEIKHEECIMFVFDKGIIPAKSIQTLFFIGYLLNRKDNEEKLKKLFSNNRFNYESKYLLKFVNNYDKFIKLMNCGIVNINDSEIYENLFSNKAYYQNEKYIDIIDDKVLEYIIKNSDIDPTSQYKTTNYSNGKSYDTKNYYIEKTLSELIDKKRSDLLIYIIEKYVDELPDLATYTYRGTYGINNNTNYTLYNKILNILNQENRNDLIAKLVENTKKLGLKLDFDFSDMLSVKKEKQTSDENEEEVNELSREDILKIKNEIKKLNDLGLPMNKKSLQIIFDTGNEELLDYLIELNMLDFNKYDSKYDIPDIHDLVRNSKSYSFLKKIFDNGYEDPWSFDLGYSIESKNTDIIGLLIDNMKENDYSYRSDIKKALNKAIELGYMDILDFIYNKTNFKAEYYKNIDKRNRNTSIDKDYPLPYLVINHSKYNDTDIELMKNVINKGFVITDDILQYAFEKKRLNIIKFFIDNNYVKLSDKYLKYAYKSDTLQYLIDNNIKIDDNTSDELKEKILKNITEYGSNKAFDLLLDKFGEYFKTLRLSDLYKNISKETSDDSYYLEKNKNEVLNVKKAFDYFKDEINFDYIYDELKRQRINTSIREKIKDIIKEENKKAKLNAKAKAKNENKNNYKNMKFIKFFEDFSTETEKETEVKPITKPKPQVNPMRPPKPVINPSPKNEEEIIKKIIGRYNRLKK